MSDNTRRANTAFSITTAYINSELDPPLWMLVCYRIMLLISQNTGGKICDSNTFGGGLLHCSF